MQNKQILVKLKNKEEGAKFLSYLESVGLKNIYNINYDKLQTKVVLIKDNSFYPTNVTCLAALASCNIKPISIDDFGFFYKI